MSIEQKLLREKKPVLLIVSFGTSYSYGRKNAIGAIETAVKEAYPDYEVRRAFTSGMILQKLRAQEGIRIDSVHEAMERLLKDGVDSLVVQSIHVTAGYEFEKMEKEVNKYKNQFTHLAIGRPLLDTEKDYRDLAEILREETASKAQNGIGVVWMGHGTEHEANRSYQKLQRIFDEYGCRNHYIGTVEATPTLNDVIARLKAEAVRSVMLLPLMIVAGEHAHYDMAGDNEKSWKYCLQEEGIKVCPIMRGLGEYSGVRELIIRHTGDAVRYCGMN